MTIPQALQIALQHHQAGRLAEAEALYRQILAVQPNHADALHLLGVIAHQAGRNDLAVEWIRQAIALEPNYAVAHCNLGEAYRALGQPDEAIDSYHRAIQLKSDYPEAHNNLGAALAVCGKLDEAMAAFLRALQLKPDYPEALKNLGIALRRQGRIDEAITAYERALRMKPHYPDVLNNLGIALKERNKLHEAIAAYRRAIELKPHYTDAIHNLGGALAAQGQWEEAVAAYRSALQIKPDYPEAMNDLGAALARRGELDEAIAAYRHALKLKTDFPEAHSNIGNALKDRGELDEAVAAHRRALEIKPDYAAAHNNLGNALRARGELDDAIVSYRRAIELKPDYPQAHNNLGNALRDRGEFDDAIAAYRRALELKRDDPGLHSNLVYALHYHPDYDARKISQEHQRWNRQFDDPLRRLAQPHSNDRTLKRRLRIGYVSPDFRDHPVGRFALPLLERHDRERFHTICYSGLARPDPITERFRALPGEWRNIIGFSDARLAELICADAVDILVDLSMHTAGNQLTLFARRPAPVQVTWLAYPGSTGLQSIGYRLTDAHMDPQGESLAWSSEEPVRLPGCWCCYEPAIKSPDINALPALSAKRVTLGSLNNFAKVNERVLTLWARVLIALEQSQLLILCPEGRARERVLAFFGARGIIAERVEFASFQERGEYLKLYRRIDIALDPFPVNGMTTTCDTLWMGVPVLTLPGEMPVSRAGLSLLSCVGLGELAAASEDDYVRIAIDLARDLPRLAKLRATLRARIQTSPLTDAPRFARNVEAAYRSIWERWRAATD